MKELQNKNIVLLDQTIIATDILSQFTAGRFRFIVKTKLGMTVCDAPSHENQRMMKYPETIIGGYNKGALQTVQFCPEGKDFYVTIFSRTGNKVKLIDEAILADLTVGTINQLFYSTNLYSQPQYGAVHSKTWTDKAYVNNIAGVDFTDSLKQLEGLSI